jgi:hypothetical protein
MGPLGLERWSPDSPFPCPSSVPQSLDGMHGYTSVIWQDQVTFLPGAGGETGGRKGLEVSPFPNLSRIGD